MQRLIDLDQTIVVPIDDETVGTSYEMQMPLEEFFKKFFDGFMPDIVEAVPVQWLKEQEKTEGKLGKAAGKVLKAWKEKEIDENLV